MEPDTASIEQAVLVPAVLGAGLLFSGLTVLRDVLHRARGRRWLDRRRLIEGRTSAALVLGGRPAARRVAAGVRLRPSYVATSALFLGLTAYTLRGSWGNFVGWTWWAEGISWWFCTMVAVSSGFAAVGVAALALALCWPEPPSWVRPLLVRTPLGAVPGTGGPADGHARRP